MKYITIWGLLLVFVLALTACAPTPAATEPATAALTEPPATTAPTEPPVSTTETSTTPATSAETGTPAVPVTGEASVMVSEDATLGSILVDGEGMTLYMFTNDTQNAGTSACTGDCAIEWPPLLSQGSPIAGQGVDAAMLGTITRDDGTFQVTYNGWPLYTFVDDLAAGDVNGQGMEGVWFVISPSGEPMMQ